MTSWDHVRIGSLFSGYGGLDLAVLRALRGSSIAWHCEIDDAPAKILEHHWPEVPNHRDVTTIDFTTIDPVDVLTGGYPCQPFSKSGQRKGAHDERHLWPYVRQAIRGIRPRVTFLENVAGHRSLGFDRVLGDLAEDGLDVRWTSVRASDVGAPHERDRVFILATYPESGRSSRDDGLSGRSAARGGGERFTRRGGRDRAAADAEGTRSRGLSGRAGSPDAGPRGDHALLPDDAQDWGKYGNAIRRWERVTRPAPAPTELNANGKPRLAAAFSEWMMGLPEGHVTAVPGVQYKHQLKALGNGVVPQAAQAALEVLLDGIAV